jgi:putative membrane protein
MDPVPTRDSVMDPTRDTVAGPVPDSAAAARDTLSLTHDWTQPLDQLKASYKEQRKLVEGFDGKAFDRAWIEHQVAFHVNALENIKKVTPSAVNPEVKALLDKTQSSVQNHLQQARTLQSKMVATQ